MQLWNSQSRIFLVSFQRLWGEAFPCSWRHDTSIQHLTFLWCPLTWLCYNLTNSHIKQLTVTCIMMMMMMVMMMMMMMMMWNSIQKKQWQSHFTGWLLKTSLMNNPPRPPERGVDGVALIPQSIPHKPRCMFWSIGFWREMKQTGHHLRLSDCRVVHNTGILLPKEVSGFHPTSPGPWSECPTTCCHDIRKMSRRTRRMDEVWRRKSSST